MGLTAGLQKGRKKLRVPILLLPKERNQYMYPQPLMHIRLRLSAMPSMTLSMCMALILDNRSWT